MNKYFNPGILWEQYQIPIIFGAILAVLTLLVWAMNPHFQDTQAQPVFIETEITGRSIAGSKLGDYQRVHFNINGASNLFTRVPRGTAIAGHKVVCLRQRKSPSGRYTYVFHKAGSCE